MGVGGAGFIASANSISQVLAPPDMRSRLLALTAVAFLGSTPIGGPITGWVGDRFGASWALAYGGLIAIASVVVAVLWLQQHGGGDASGNSPRTGADGSLRRAMLDERKAAILLAIVREHIATGQPVGSAHVAGGLSVKVSSATVRNEMAVLEQEGYLRQPHTSAGRVPTDKAYRVFVDQLATPGPRRDPGAAGAGVLRHHPWRARADAPRHQPPALEDDRLRSRRDGAADGGSPPCVRCSSSGCPPMS